jgi:hypothetical protein
VQFAHQPTTPSSQAQKRVGFLTTLFECVMVYLVFKVLVSFDTYILAHQMYKNFFAYFTPQTPRTYARLYKGREKRYSDCMIDIFHKKGPKKAQLCGFTALCNLPEKGYIGGLDKKEKDDFTPFLPTVIHSHSRPIPLPSTTYLPPSHSQQFSIPLRLPYPYPAIGLPLRANRIPAPFSALSRHLNIVLFCDNNVTLLPQNALFSLDFIQKHRIIVQFQAI